MNADPGMLWRPCCHRRAWLMSKTHKYWLIARIKTSVTASSRGPTVNSVRQTSLYRSMDEREHASNIRRVYFVTTDFWFSVVAAYFSLPLTLNRWFITKIDRMLPQVWTRARMCVANNTKINSVYLMSARKMAALLHCLHCFRAVLFIANGEKTMSKVFPRVSHRRQIFHRSALRVSAHQPWMSISASS